MESGPPKDSHASWRCFIAFDLSDEVRASAARIQSALRTTDADVSFPHPANFHLTLHFLGDTLTGKIAPLESLLDTICSATPPFLLTFKGLGFFGPPRHPRVIWAGLDAPPGEIFSLHEKLLAALLQLGFFPDQRAFRPHLTLGRIRSARGLPSLKEKVESLRDTSLGTTPVKNLLLIRSHLDRPEARYEILHEANLTGA